jgi:hypothetical protein
MPTDISDFYLSSAALAALCSLLFDWIQNPVVLLAFFRQNASAIATQS